MLGPSLVQVLTHQMTLHQWHRVNFWILSEVVICCGIQTGSPHLRFQLKLSGPHGSLKLVFCAGIVVAIATVTFVVSNLIGSAGSKVKPISAGAAFAALEEKPNAFLLDIRRKKEASTDGSPDIRSTKRKVETLAFSQVTH